MNTPVKRYSTSSSDNERSSQVSLEKPKLDLNRSINKAEEEEKVKLLLRDDFIDDGDSLDIENAPILLPLIKEGFYCYIISNNSKNKSYYINSCLL